VERKGQVALAPSLIQTKNTSAAIATYAIICASIYGLLAISFYALMQPAQIPNPGLLAYKPPPATVITYQAGALSDVTRAMAPPAAPSAVDRISSPGNLLENTTPTVIQGPEPKDLAAMAAVPPVKERPTRRPARPRKPAAAQATVRNRVQPSGGVAAAYPGYAAVR
jgi:hypothetical protein